MVIKPPVLIRQRKEKINSAPPGNRTRVARMGILHDTTTPAVLTTLPDVQIIIHYRPRT